MIIIYGAAKAAQISMGVFEHIKRGAGALDRWMADERVRQERRARGDRPMATRMVLAYPTGHKKWDAEIESHARPWHAAARLERMSLWALAATQTAVATIAAWNGYSARAAAAAADAVNLVVNSFTAANATLGYPVGVGFAVGAALAAGSALRHNRTSRPIADWPARSPAGLRRNRPRTARLIFRHR